MGGQIWTFRHLISQAQNLLSSVCCSKPIVIAVELTLHMHFKIKKFRPSSPNGAAYNLQIPVSVSPCRERWYGLFDRCQPVNGANSRRVSVHVAVQVLSCRSEQPGEGSEVLKLAC